jgi:hypothetical protein
VGDQGGDVIITPVGEGDVPLETVWDGLTSLGYMENVHPVPDADGDGIYDYWYLWKLLPGPLPGKNAYAEFENTSDPIASFPDPTDPSRGFAEVDLAGFDADGDGHDDVLVDFGGGNLRQIYFGPLLGEIPEVGSLRATYFGTGDSDECQDPPKLLRDVRGPGDHVIVVGGQDAPRWCYPDWFLLHDEAEQQPGYSIVDSTLDMPSGFFQAIPDLDGDGRAELLASSGLQQLSGVWPHPFDGEHGVSQLEPLLSTVSSVPGYLLGTIGDANGDGVPDLLGTTNPSANTTGDIPPDLRTYVLLSPHDDPIDIEAGILIEPVTVMSNGGRPGWAHGDFDEDGLHDLAYGLPWEDLDDPFGPGRPDQVVFYYSGADLTAADPRTTSKASAP